MQATVENLNKKGLFATRYPQTALSDPPLLFDDSPLVNDNHQVTRFPRGYLYNLNGSF